MPIPIGLITAAVAAVRFQAKNATLTTLSGKSLQGSGDIVLAVSPTIVTPTVASFVNATHTHQDAAGGGSLDAAAIGSGTLANARINFAAPSAIGGTTPAAVAATTLTATVSDAATATVTDVGFLSHNSTGTAATSFGTGLRFRGESSTTDNTEMGRIRALWTTATHASRVSNLVLSAYNIGTETDVLTLTPTGLSSSLALAGNVVGYTLANFALGITGAITFGGHNALVATSTASPSSFTDNRPVTGATIGVTFGSGAGISAPAASHLTALILSANNDSVFTVATLIGMKATMGASRATAVVTTGEVIRAQIANAASTTITSGTLIHLLDGTSTGTLTTQYGLYIDALTKGGTNYAIVTNTGLIVFNEGGDAVSDVRMEGDTDANLFFLDVSADMLGLKTSAPTAVLDVNSDVIRLRTAKTPASAAATGNAGDHAWDSGFFYICTATNTWRRVAHASW